MKKGIMTNSARWFEKHKGHPMEVKAINKTNLSDYKCLKCRVGLITPAAPGDKPKTPNALLFP